MDEQAEPGRATRAARPPDGAEPELYLAKPITPSVLIQEVRAVLAG